MKYVLLAVTLFLCISCENEYESYIKEGNKNCANGQLKEALFCFTKAIELDSTNGKAYLLRGKIFRKLNANEIAVEDFKKSLDLQNYDAYEWLESTLLEINPPELKKGDLALLKETVYILNRRQIKNFKKISYRKNKQINANGRVLVLGKNGSFAKVRTLTNFVGYIELDKLQRIEAHRSDMELFSETYSVRKIETIVNGYDILKVNLWNDAFNRKKVMARVARNESVAVIKVKESYVQVATTEGKIGWCRYEFLK
ncbi:MAG: hypothetical protein ACEPOW_14350 [Bacteroidales bacterium]